MQTKLRLVLSIPLLFFGLNSMSQQTGVYWENGALITNQSTLSGQLIKQQAARAFVLREEQLRNQLKELHEGDRAEVLLSFPDASGSARSYRVRERSVMSAELQRRYPGIRSYVGYSVEGDPSKVRFSLSHKGLQGMITEQGTSRTHYLERAPGSPDTYLLFSRDELQPLPEGWKCKTETQTGKTMPGATVAKLFDDQQLRTYRLAVATTGEYAQYHGGTVADALAAINATLTRINEVFERDLAIRLELIPETDRVIYTDPNTDPFGGNLSSEVQTTLTTVIGPGSYDIGHLFHQAGENGNAGFIGAVCVDNRKGSAFASTPNPEGDRFDLDFVAHEMGHQFGANHTWSFQSEGTGVQAEPGSGSTIMAYAGITQDDDVQSAGDDYFHYYSILQISQYVIGTTCGVMTPLDNSPPVITPVPDFRIPKGTAFVLEAKVTDADPEDQLTFAWEQIDDGVVTRASFGPENPAGANFRSRPPVNEPRRYFPLLSLVSSGNLTQTDPASGSAWETVSTVERDLNFALTVRDNAPDGGQLSSELSRVSVEEEAGPFQVLSQNVAEVYDIGSVQQISWDVAGTNSAPVNTQLVDIYLSADGGLSFPYLIAEDVPNTGEADIQMPRVPNPFGRFMVKAAENVYFAVNDADFTLSERPYLLYFDDLQVQTCQPQDAVFNFTFQTFGGFEEPVALEVVGLPEGMVAEFSTDTVQVDDSRISLVLSGTESVSPGTYALEVLGTDGGTSTSVPLLLQVAGDSFVPPILISPADGATDVNLRPELLWESDSSVTSYDVEIATDASFVNIVQQQRVYGNSYQPGPLEVNSIYFWRVRPVSACGDGEFTSFSSFSTLSSGCRTLVAGGTPIPISSTGTPTVTSVITVADDRPVLAVRVGVDVEHTFVSDLIITLTSPEGTKVTLVSNSCGEANDINAIFDAEAPIFVCGNNPAISGEVRPLGSLNAFAGESSFGEWVLTIEDTAPADGGRLNNFSLELCVEGFFRPDEDADGVFDDGDDLCLGTPPGSEVDANGCEVFRFPDDRFLISITSETCIGAGDGSVEVSSKQPFDYTIQIQGNGIDRTDAFTSTYTFSGLDPGSYEVCIGGTDGVNLFERQCFQVNIESPEPLSILADLALDYSSVTLHMDGSDLFEITLNGRTQFVEGPRYTLELEKGVNQLKVSGMPACKGSYEATFLRTERPLVAPNPFKGRLDIYLPEAVEPAEIAVFSASGTLVWRGKRVPEAGTITLNLAGVPTGLYLIQVTQKGILTTHKVYRE
jgi:subtilisin-like proprotein convertase family protein